MARSFRAPGLTCDWLNAWLAAVGTAVLLPEVRLRWTADPIPVAVFDVADERPLADSVWTALPSDAQVRKMAIARNLGGYPEFPWKVDENAYRARAALARVTSDFSLAASVTDLEANLDPHELPRSSFNVPMPAGVTLWQRLEKCRAALDQGGSSAVEETLAGRGHRVLLNGLGFDARRLVAGVQPTAKLSVDPVVECLAFVALSLFPVRGKGRSIASRGWIKERDRFVWPVWRHPLDRWAIDALTDQIPTSLGDKGLATRWGITGWFETVPYEWEGSDPTRAYFSRPLSSDNAP